MKIKFLTVLSLTIVLLLGACGGKSDADIQTAADTAIKAESTTSGVTVDVKDGVATISGDVADDAAKAKAEELAKVEGVKNVINEVNVNAPAPTPTASAADPELKTKVEEALKKAGCANVTVDVNDGVATLTGTVKSSDYVKCFAAASEAKPKSIENNLKKN